jgi:hypothetical protein
VLFLIGFGLIVAVFRRSSPKNELFDHHERPVETDLGEELDNEKGSENDVIVDLGFSDVPHA